VPPAAAPLESTYTRNEPTGIVSLPQIIETHRDTRAEYNSSEDQAQIQPTATYSDGSRNPHPETLIKCKDEKLIEKPSGEGIF
jgi:hypothetical protein